MVEKKTLKVMDALRADDSLINHLPFQALQIKGSNAYILLELPIKSSFYFRFWF